MPDIENIMSSSTALLPSKNKKKKDHPIFMRICHSSWDCIGQKPLVTLRMLIASYLFGSFVSIINYDLFTLKLGWFTVFKLTNIAYFMLVIFHVLAAVWAFMHLHYPHHASQPRSFATRLQKFLSPPRQNSDTKNRDWFSIFYFSAHAFTLVVAFIFWVVLYRKKKTTIPDKDFFDHDDYTTFYLLAKYVFTVAIVIFEVFVLNGHIRSLPASDHPKRISWHIIAFATLAWMYIGWAYLGHHWTGKYAYYFLDFKKYGRQRTWFSILIFVAAVEAAAAFLWLLTALKESCTQKEEKNNGYSALPQ